MKLLNFFRKHCHKSNKATESSVPQEDETILSHEAKEKFNDAMSTGYYLTPDMNSLLIANLKQD